jgi:mRNA interferase YafQ
MDKPEGSVYTVKPTTRFKRDLRRIGRQQLDESDMAQVINTLARREKLEPKYRDHSLTGEYKGCRECHIAPDWLLVYQIDDEYLYLYLVRTGSHSELFSR